MMNFFSFLTLIFLTVSCIKTAEQLKREKRFDTISTQVGDTQGLVAEMITRSKDLQKQIDTLNGKLEEIEYNQSKLNPEEFKSMSENLALVKTQQEAQNTQLLQIQNELKEQRAFMEKVTETLAAISKSSSSKKKKSAKEDLNQGLAYIKKDKYVEARRKLESLIDHKDLTPGERNKVLHGLGKVEFYTKNYDKALVFFSKIITRYPRASLAPSSLLFIGRSLSRMGKKDEARQAFLKVVEDYKDSREANEARKEL